MIDSRSTTKWKRL